MNNFLESRVQALEQQLAQSVNLQNQPDNQGFARVLFSDLFGGIQTVSSAPTAAPINVYDQVKVYVSGTTYRLYVYDTKAAVWHYATLT